VVAAVGPLCGSILLKKYFEEDPRVILIQDEHPTSKIDPKLPPFGFDYFKFLFHIWIFSSIGQHRLSSEGAKRVRSIPDTDLARTFRKVANGP
jgi:hypothetical protein